MSYLDRVNVSFAKLTMSAAIGFPGFAAVSIVDSLAGQIFCLCLAVMGVYGAFPVFWTLPTAFLTGTAAAAGIAPINSVSNLAATSVRRWSPGSRRAAAISAGR